MLTVNVDLLKELTTLESLGARFCRIKWGDKRPIGSAWQKNPLSLSQINLKTEGIGLVFGFGNLFALDIDNPEGRDRFIEYFGVAPTDYPSVSWASGKNFTGEYQPELTYASNIQILLKLSDTQAEQLEGRKVFKNNSLDLRWHGSQSVLPSVSPHPSTGNPYIWHHAPTEWAIAEMPNGIWEKMIADVTRADSPTLPTLPTIPVAPPTHTTSSVGDPPLTIFLAREHRDFIDQGIAEGGRNDAGFRLASDLIGTEEQLARLGIRHTERARDLFDYFCDRCSPSVSSRDRDVIWKSASKKSPKACLTEEMMRNCLTSWTRNQTRSEEKAENFSGKIDSAWAGEIAKFYQEKLAWDESIKEWRFYQDGYWQTIPSLRVCGLIKQYMASQGKGCTNGKLNSVESILKIDLFCDEWNTNTDLIPFADGCYSISKNKKLSHSSKYRFTWKLPHNYESKENSWEKIDQWFTFATGGNQRDKNILIAFAAATLKGKSDLHKFLHLQGIGGSGKSTYIRLLEDLVGEDNHYSSSLVEWNNTRFESANGFGKRLISFPDENSKISNVESLKKLTGGDSIRYEEKGKKASNYKFTGMVVIASNASPFVGASSSAIARRQIEVMFNAIVPNGKRRNLNREFQPELSAFSRHLLDLTDEWIMEVLNETQGFGTLTASSWENQCQNDSIAAWVDEHIIWDDRASQAIGNKRATGDENFEECLTLYQSYTLFCNQAGYLPKSYRRFSADLCELAISLGKEVLRIHTRIGNEIRGIRLRKAKSDAEIPTYTEILEAKEKSEAPTPATTAPGGVKDSVKDSVKDETLAPQGREGCEGFSDKSFYHFSPDDLTEIGREILRAAKDTDAETFQLLLDAYNLSQDQKRIVWAGFAHGDRKLIKNLTEKSLK